MSNNNIIIFNSYQNVHNTETDNIMNKKTLNKLKQSSVNGLFPFL